MTPDELPAGMEGRLLTDVNFWPFTPEATSTGPRHPWDMADDLRDLLKAYQEQRRALERLANKDNEFGSEVQTIARAALNQKGDER
jgi:hypothetical protein